MASRMHAVHSEQQLRTTAEAVKSAACGSRARAWGRPDATAAAAVAAVAGLRYSLEVQRKGSMAELSALCRACCSSDTPA